MSRYFLSFGGENRAAARALANGLRAVGVNLFLDEEEITYGSQWLTTLERELASCDGFLSLIGEQDPSGWAKAELDVAMNRQAHQPSFRIIPFLLPARNVDSLPGFLNRFHAYKLPLEPIDAAAEHFSAIALLLGLRSTPDTADCPFPDLESFDERLELYFFGRAYEIQELLAQLRAGLSHDCRWLQIEGGSGTGKSSLAQAGLIPGLRHTASDHRLNEWHVSVMRPGLNPLRNLAQAVCSAVKSNWDERWTVETMAKAMETSASALVNLIREGTSMKIGFLLLVDQLEEVFTVGDANQAAQFALVLREALDDLDVTFYLVTTIRSDLLSHFVQLPALEELLASRTIRYYLRPLSPSGIKAAIEGPSHAAGLVLEEGLVERILTDVAVCRGGLPIIAHVLYALWATRPQNTLTHRSYDVLGGVTGALTVCADAVIDRLPQEAQIAATNAFLCLVSEAIDSTSSSKTSDPRNYISRRATRSEVIAAMGNDSQAEAVLTYLSGGRTAHFSKSAPAFMRLVTVTAGGPEDRIDLVHEALIHEWPRLQTWISDHSDKLRKRDALEAHAIAWVATGRQLDDLPTGSQLSYLRDAFPASELAREFLAAASAHVIRLRRRRWYVAAAFVGLAIVAYLIACDFGLHLRGRRLIRVLLDEYHLSLFQPLRPIPTIQANASLIRLGLARELQRRFMTDGNVSIDYQLTPTTDSWATGQTMAGLLACEQCTSQGGQASQWVAHAMNHMFSPGSVYRGPDGLEYGWPRMDKRVTMAEPAVWIESAIARAYSHPIFGPQRRPLLMNDFQSTVNILRQYRSADGIALNSFSRQVDRARAGVYPTVMELIALLDARATGNLVGVAGGENRIRELAKWLCTHFDSSRGGWPAVTNTRDAAVVDGLKFQVFSALLMVERDVGFSVPKEILTAIPPSLQDAAERDYNYPLDEIKYNSAFRDANGSRTVTNELIVILWHPWAVHLASLWLQRSERPRHQSASDAAIAHRALDHLIIDIAPEIDKRSRQTYTYEIAETLYAISIQ